MYLLTRYDYIWFCTFTLSDKYINKSYRTKKRLLNAVLDTHDFKYILNIDYGENTNREHFHCILATNIDFDVNQFIQGNYPCHCLAINCKKGREDFVRLTKYINKLVNHCLKSSTKRHRMIYNFKGYDDWFPTYHERTLQYKKEMYDNFELSGDSHVLPLLDKGEITGQI